MNRSIQFILFVLCGVLLGGGGVYVFQKTQPRPSSPPLTGPIRYNCELSAGKFQGDRCVCPLENDQTQEMMYDRNTGFCQSTNGGPIGAPDGLPSKDYSFWTGIIINLCEKSGGNISGVACICPSDKTYNRGTGRCEDTSVNTDAVSFSKKFHFTVSCPMGTIGYERFGSYVCSDSSDGIWQGEVDVTSTSVQLIKEVVQTNNAKLTLKDPAYMQTVREARVDDGPAIIVKQTNGDEAGPASDHLAQTMLVIHDGLLYSVHTREYQADVDTFFDSFHFTNE